METAAGFDESIKRLLTTPHASHKLYIWREILDRIYLDSCSLVDILLGQARSSTSSGTSPKKLTREKELVRARDAELARRIADRWLPSHLVLSPYVIGEFLEVAVHTFSRSEADAQKVLVDFIRRGVTVRYADLDLRFARVYDAIGTDPRLLLSLKLEGAATGSDGTRYSGAEGGFRLDRSGQTVRYANVGLPPDASLPEPMLQFGSDAVPTVSAPAYELAFFHTVAGLVGSTRVNWKDAFHYLYAKWANAQAILTTNKKDFVKSGKQVSGYPPVYTPSEFEAEMRSLHPELHDLIFNEDG